MSKQPYQCPRCEYMCKIRQDIKKHFSRKTICPCKNDIVLTDEIKDFVYINRVYHPPKLNKQQIVNQSINHYNMLNNFLVQMDPLDKIKHLLEYHDKRLLGFEDRLEVHYSYRVDRMENDKYVTPYMLNQENLLSEIDKLSKIDISHDPENKIGLMNILHDRTMKRLKIWSGFEWESFLEDIGAKEIVSLIKSYFFDIYEKYLLIKLHKDGQAGYDRAKIKEHLEIYYKFIGMFDLFPYIIDVTDSEILGHRLKEDNERFLGETYMCLYQKLKISQKQSELNHIKRSVISILKNNTNHNIDQLNQSISELVKVNRDFKEKIVGQYE